MNTDVLNSLNQKVSRFGAGLLLTVLFANGGEGGGIFEYIHNFKKGISYFPIILYEY